MKTTIEKTFTVRQPLEKVWTYLSDPAKVVPCVPGAQLTEQLDERHYRGTVTLKVGPVSASYKGEITMRRSTTRRTRSSSWAKGWTRAAREAPR